MKEKKAVRVLFILRVILWILAFAATLYWIIWSFRLYDMGMYDVHEYSSHLRPIFWRGFLSSVGCICLSLILRSISDKIKKRTPRA